MQQGGPYLVDAPLELGKGTVVLDNEIGAGPLQLGGHLGGDHFHRFGFPKTALFHEALEAHGAVRIYEHNAVEAVGHVPLEEKRDVTDHDTVAAPSRLIDQARTKAFDFRVDDLVKFFELVVIGEDDAAERGAVEMAVGREN